MQFLFMLAPTVLSLSIFEYMTKPRGNWFRIQYFCNGSLAINGVALTLLYILRGDNLNFDFAGQAPAALLKFLAVYGVVAVAMALVLVGLTNRIEIKMEKRHEET